jgi:hypothetical protein
MNIKTYSLLSKSISENNDELFLSLMTEYLKHNDFLETHNLLICIKKQYYFGIKYHLNSPFYPKEIEQLENAIFIYLTKYGNVELFSLFVKNFNIINIPEKHSLSLAAEYNKIDIIKFLLTQKIDIAYLKNNAIVTAYNLGYFEIVDLLWQQESVKSSLMNDNLDIFSILNKKDINQKLQNF